MEQLKSNLNQNKSMHLIVCWVRALRLPFVTASIIPFIAGTLLLKNNISILKFSLGILAAVFTHLGANLINDYADSKTGADWHDKKFYGFFGGSKLIQEGILTEKQYLKAALLLFCLSVFALIGLMFLLQDLSVVGFYLVIALLSIFYSQKPFNFSYRYLGEAIIFILFGPALVMGAYFIQSGIFPSKEAFLLSLPFGFLTTAILFVNEIPDHKEDLKANKFTLVNLFTVKHAYYIYFLLIVFAIASVFINIYFQVLSKISFLCVLIFPFVFKSINIVKNSYNEKEKLTESSKMTILIQTIIGILIIVDLIV